jgi:hypothetical protein
VARETREGDNLSFLTAKHSMQTVSGVLLLGTRPETGIGRFLALLIVIYNAADPRRQIAPGFLLAFTHVQSAHRAAEFGRDTGSVQELPRSQVEMHIPHTRRATLSNWASYRVIGDAR